jgi:hypothetical protein
LIDDLDEGAETAIRQSRKAVDGPVRAAFKPRPRQPRPGRFAAAGFAIPCEVSRDTLLEIGLDLFCGRALLDGVGRQPWLSMVLTDGAEHIGGSLPRRPRGERPSLQYVPTGATVPRLSQAVAAWRRMGSLHKLRSVAVPFIRRDNARMVGKS